MANLSFRMFTFPQNPETFEIRATRSPQYTIEEDGTITYDGLGPLCRVITGSGVFCGSDAVGRFNALAVMMATGTMGDLVHPKWGTFSAYLTGLQMEQDSRPDYVKYSFTFREADESGMIPKLPDND